ncbi:LacI family DNA-binding transcriptional regulator [Streptomyces sp. NPDC004752]
MGSRAGRGGNAGGTGRRKTTQADVARHAGVSTGIVSSVINGRDYGSIRVSEATRDRVRQSIRELGYVPNIAARNLARGSNRLLGVFTYQPIFPLESRDFFHEFLIGIEEEAERAGYNLLLVTGSKDEHGRRSIYADGVNNLQLADGSLLIGSNESAEELTRLSDESYPFVFVGHREIPGVDLSYVAADYAGGTAAIVRALVERGHRRIALVQNDQVLECVPGRRTGFRACRSGLGLSEDDAPVLSLGTGVPTDSDVVVPDVPALLQWVARHGSTALVVEVSTDAAEIRSAAVAAGLDVPGDLALVGLSGTPEQPQVSDLAELHIPRREMGQEAVRLLLRLLAAPQDAPLRSTLDCGLRAGATLCP